MSSLVLISIIVAIVIIIAIILIVLLSKKKNKNSETPASILDVENIGVSTNNQEFSYGYEKEETIVMQPVDLNMDNMVNSEEKEAANIQNTNALDSKVLNVSTDDVSKHLDIPNELEKTSEHIEDSNINNEVQNISNNTENEDETLE